MTTPIPSPSTAIDTVAAALVRARRVLFITGAGLSADSGLPTYRGIGGLYNGKLTGDQVAIEDALSGAMLARNPTLTWKYLLQIEQACRGASYNDGHRIIARLQSHVEHCCVLTQNVDGFHRAAGSSNVIDIHGDLHDLHCTDCSYAVTVADYSGLSLPPTCPDCGALVRPAVVLFGEMLPQQAIAHYHDELGKAFDMVFSIGTTSVFPYIGGPVVEARQRGVTTVEINPSVTEVSAVVDHKIAAGAAETLRSLWQRGGFGN